jgi:peptidase S41-like protein
METSSHRSHTGLRNQTLLLALVVLLIGNTLAQSTAPAASTLTREETWRADLRYLATELPKRHKDLFFHLKQEDFERSIAQLDNAIPKLQDHEIIVKMMGIVASVGDTHTNLNARFGSIYPLGLLWFKDGLYLMRAPAEYKYLLGSRLIRIGETNIQEAHDKVAQVIAHENQQWLLVQSPSFLIIPDVLTALKILPDSNKGRFVFKDAKDKTHTLDLAPVADLSKLEMVYAVDPDKPNAPLYRQKANLNYWFEYLADSKTLYVKYSRCANMQDLPFAKFNEQLWAFAANQAIEKFVVDLRLNAGGNSIVFWPLLAELKKRSEFHQRGKLFIIIGRSTFSSGYINALELQQQTKAILIGESTGQKPNAYGEVLSFKLPHSGLSVQYSTKYYKTIDNDSVLFMSPDIVVEQTAADYLAGRDPVLEEILKYRDKK